MAQAPGLKKPVGIYILAILFVLAPIGNILISFAGSGINNWYEPSVFMAFLQSIPAWDWAWLLLLIITGILLFRPHKLSWSFAIFTLVLILVVNAVRLHSADTNSIDPGYLKIFSALALLCTIGVLVIAFYFRFPYLDRRADWVKNLERYDIKTTAVVEGVTCQTESISLSGCRVISPEPLRIAEGQHVQLTLKEVYDRPVLARVIQTGGTTTRLEYMTEDSDFYHRLKGWVKSNTGA